MLTSCIDPTTLRQDNFEGFTAARQRSLLTKIESVMDKTIMIFDEAVPEDETDEDD